MSADIDQEVEVEAGQDTEQEGSLRVMYVCDAFMLFYTIVNLWRTTMPNAIY